MQWRTAGNLGSSMKLGERTIALMSLESQGFNWREPSPFAFEPFSIVTNGQKDLETFSSLPHAPYIGLLDTTPTNGSSWLPYSGKYLWGRNFVLFILNLSERKFNTWNMDYDGCVFLCKMDKTKIKHELAGDSTGQNLDFTKISWYTVWIGHWRLNGKQ